MKTRIWSAAFAVMAFGVSGASAQTSGDYLSARHATQVHDYAQAQKSFARALLRNPGQLGLQEFSMRVQIAAGDTAAAVETAQYLASVGVDSPLVRLTQFSGYAGAGDFDAALDMLDAGAVAGASLDHLLRGWVYMGQGRVQLALDSFDVAATQNGIAALARYQRALALCMVGNFEAAEAVFTGADGRAPVQPTERGALALAQIMVQLDKRDAAAGFLTDRFAGTDNAQALAFADHIKAGTALDFDIVSNAADGIAEVLYIVATSLRSSTDADVLLFYTRLAHHLSPKHIDALLLTAKFLEDLDNPGLATVAYDQVPRTHPSFLRAELGRAAALKAAGRSDAAVEVLSQLAETHPDVRRVHMDLANVLRRDENYFAAQQSYDRIVAGLDAPAASDWFLYFARGVTFERQEKWDAAEADFRKALALSPDQAVVLNYLGYSFLDRNINLQEGLELIQRAVALAPDKGHIVDSMGWALYKIGDYDRAVAHLEKAVSLLATDPVVNDHLGDAYWMVGRRTEARFQWQRAASFNPDPEVADRISEKLTLGLDLVMGLESQDTILVGDGR